MVFESTPCWEFFIEPATDPMIIILAVAACVAIAIGVVKEGEAKGAPEGVAIIVAISIVVSVSAWNDWSKEQEFRKLQEVSASSQKYFVLRNGKEEEIEFEEIVIGDVLKLN